MITLSNIITHFLQFFFDENQYLSSINKPESESLSSVCINLGDGGKRCEGVPDGLQLGIDRVVSLRLPLLRPVPGVLLCPRLQQRIIFAHILIVAVAKLNKSAQCSCSPRAGRSST